ncbi:MAG: hypothetical protein AAFW59_06320 [Pseudomonadota bacterium]
MIRRFALAIFLCLGIVATPTAFAQENTAQTFQKVMSGASLDMTPQTTLALGGAIDVMTSQCDDLTIAPLDRPVLATFVQTAATRAAVGGRYSDPNLSETLGSQASGAAYYNAAGLYAIQTYGCGAGGSRLLSRIADTINASKASSVESTFVKTCKARHSEATCVCTAEIGRSVNPKFDSLTYSADTVRSIIGANPFLGIQIAGRCGLVNY